MAKKTQTTTEISSPQRNPKKLRPIWLHVLAAGTHQGQNGAVTISDADIAQIAKTYDPKLHEAPAVLGHPQTDDPALGWARSLEVRDDGLWANADLLPQLTEMVGEQKYNRISVSLYPPHASLNPVPGSFYLKHIGFLGAHPPAVKGLMPVALAESDDSIVINFSNEEETPMAGKDEKKDEKTTDKPVGQSEVNLSERESAISLAEADLAKRTKALRRNELEGKLNVHMAAGRVLPSQKPLLLELAERCDNQTVTFSEGKEESLLEAFDQFLGKLPKQIELAEIANPAQTSSAPVNFSAPPGFDVDPEQLAQHKQAEAYLKANPDLTYIQALQAVQAGA